MTSKVDLDEAVDPSYMYSKIAYNEMLNKLNPDFLLSCWRGSVDAGVL